MENGTRTEHARYLNSGSSDTHVLHPSPQISVVNDPGAGFTEVTVRGRWNPGSRTSLSTVLRACLADIPRVVIADLTAFSDDTGASATTWRIAAQYAAARSPASRLFLCAAPPGVRRRLNDDNTRTADQGPRPTVAVFASVAEARDALAGDPPVAPRIRLLLPPDRQSPSLGRTAAGDACLRWGLPHLTHRARLIMSELVGNSVEHAGTAMTVMASLRGDVLHLAVQDQTSALPRLIYPVPYQPGELIEQRGRGLQVVRAAATAWGALPCHVGKVVWATIDARRATTS